MKPLIQPEISRGYTTTNGVRLLITSWPYPVRNNRGRAIEFRHHDIQTSIKLDTFFSAETFRNPELLGYAIQDLEEPEQGHSYKKALERDLHMLLFSLGSPNPCDHNGIMEAVTATRAALYKAR